MIAFSASQRTVASRVAHAQIIAVPFTLEAEQYKVTPNGLEAKKMIKKARRSDGTTAEMDSVGI